jgi:hypothetical protein
MRGHLDLLQRGDGRRGSAGVSLCKVAWTTVCKLTYLGGLGILDLRFFGYTL